jgi:hypothetical protein
VGRVLQPATQRAPPDTARGEPRTAQSRRSATLADDDPSLPPPPPTRHSPTAACGPRHAASHPGLPAQLPPAGTRQPAVMRLAPRPRMAAAGGATVSQHSSAPLDGTCRGHTKRLWVPRGHEPRDQRTRTTAPDSARCLPWPQTPPVPRRAACSRYDGRPARHTTGDGGSGPRTHGRNGHPLKRW